MSSGEATATSTPTWALPDSVAYDRDGNPWMAAGLCSACSATVFPKPKVCPKCWSENIDDIPLARKGTIYSYTVVHVARKGWNPPYVIAFVDLDDGVRVSAPIACDPAHPPPIDSRVRLQVKEIYKNDDGTPVLSHHFAKEA